MRLDLRATCVDVGILSSFTPIAGGAFVNADSLSQLFRGDGEDARWRNCLPVMMFDMDQPPFICRWRQIGFSPYATLWSHQMADAWIAHPMSAWRIGLVSPLSLEAREILSRSDLAISHLAITQPQTCRANEHGDCRADQVQPPPA
jgi:hypothetical protein